MQALRWQPGNRLAGLSPGDNRSRDDTSAEGGAIWKPKGGREPCKDKRRGPGLNFRAKRLAYRVAPQKTRRQTAISTTSQML